MALAYAVVFVTAELWDHHRSQATEMAQSAADERFEKLAQENMKGLVTRNPEPHVMSWEEMRNMLPGAHLEGLVGLKFMADIT